MAAIRKISAFILLCVYALVWMHNQSHIHCVTTGAVISVCYDDLCHDIQPSVSPDTCCLACNNTAINVACQDTNLTKKAHNHQHSSNCEMILSIPQNNSLEKLALDVTRLTPSYDLYCNAEVFRCSFLCQKGVCEAIFGFREQIPIKDQYLTQSASFRAPPVLFV